MQILSSIQIKDFEIREVSDERVSYNCPVKRKFLSRFSIFRREVISKVILSENE